MRGLQCSGDQAQAPREKRARGSDIDESREKRPKSNWRCVSMEKRKVMKILILTAIMTLPLMAFGQGAEQQQSPTQTKETEATAPAKTRTERPAQEETKPQTKKPERATDERAKTDVQDRDRDVNKGKSETRAESANDERVGTDVNRSRDENKSQTETRSNSSTSRTKVSVEQFRSRHTEMFNLGRHPKEFFIQKYGEKHFRLIGNTYFVFLDGCWVAVDVDGFTYTQRVICEGDPEFVEIVD